MINPFFQHIDLIDTDGMRHYRLSLSLSSVAGSSFFTIIELDILTMSNISKFVAPVISLMRDETGEAALLTQTGKVVHRHYKTRGAKNTVKN